MKVVHKIQVHWDFTQREGWPEHTTIFLGEEFDSNPNPFPLQLEGDYRPPEGHHLEIRVVIVPDNGEEARPDEIQH